MRKFRVPLVAVTACLMCVAPASAALTGTETLKLDSYKTPNTGVAGPVSTADTLAAGQLYNVTVRGTYSAYLPSLWLGSEAPSLLPCGAPKNAPVTPSPAGPGTGRVGADAETIFAAIERGGCNNPYPRHHSHFQINTGTGFAHPEPVGGPVATPSADNGYSYAVTGAGQPAAFRIEDFDTRDNYGQLTITVTRAVQAPRQVKRDVRANLAAQLPTGNTGNDKKLQEAIERIDKSLTPQLWIDDSHLNPKKGKEVFYQERHAVQKLREVSNNNPPIAVRAAIDALVALDRELSQIAINEATTAGGQASELAKAREELAKGDKEASSGKPDKAIEHYGHAWEHAIKSR